MRFQIVAPRMTMLTIRTHRGLHQGREGRPGRLDLAQAQAEQIHQRV